MSTRLSTLLETAQINYPPVAIYDVPDAELFEPFVEPGRCVFEGFRGWLEGKSTVISKDTAASFQCSGAGYYLCGVRAADGEDMAYYLAEQEGLKASTEIMGSWLAGQTPYQPQQRYVVFSQLVDGQDRYLRTVTFFVNPDQLSLFITGAEYFNASVASSLVSAPYGAGCALMLSMFSNLDEPAAIVGGTDIAMRKHLPRDVLAFTATRPLFEQLCQLGQDSFLYKTFWNDVKRVRASSPTCC